MARLSNMTTEVILPEVFTNPDFEYTGSEVEKAKSVECDLLCWQGCCHMGVKTRVNAFNRAFDKMSHCISHDVFMLIADRCGA